MACAGRRPPVAIRSVQHACVLVVFGLGLATVAAPHGGARSVAHTCAKPSKMTFHPHSHQCRDGAPSTDRYIQTLSKPEESHAVPKRGLPRLVVIGAHKGGSTALFAFLARHKDIRPSYCKEPLYVVHEYHVVEQAAEAAAQARGLAPGSGFVQGVLRHRYSQYFRPQIPGCAPFWSMEGTPRYLPAGHPTPSRLKALAPDVQLVAVLRKMSSRAESHFANKRRTDFREFGSCSAWVANFTGGTSISACLKLRPRLRHGPVGRGGAPQQSRPAWIAAWQAYSECLRAANPDNTNPFITSMYAPQLFQWLEVFPANRLYILQSEALLADAQAQMNQLFRHLGLEPQQAAAGDSKGKVVNKSHKHKGGFGSTDCSSETKAEMAAFFAPHEADLFDILAEVSFLRRLTVQQRGRGARR